MKAKASLMGLPKTIWAGEMLQSGSGVFLICIIARKNLSVSSDPEGPVLARRRRLVDLTATCDDQIHEEEGCGSHSKRL